MKKMVFLCMGVAAFVLMAHAALAGEIVLLFQNGPNQASDVDRLYLIDRVRNVDSAGNPLPADSPPTVGQIDIGDSLRGSINFNTLNSASANVGGSTGNNELSGVFQFLITGKANVGGGDPPDQWVYTFGPDPSFTALYGPGAMVAAYEDPSPDYTADFDDPAPATPPAGPDDGTAARTVPPSSGDVSVGPYATEEAFIATAVDGTWRMTLGFLGLPGEGANAQGFSGAGDSMLQSFGATSASAFISVNLGLNLLAMNPAWAAALAVNRVTASAFGGAVDFAGSQQIMGVSDLDTPFEASSNTTISFDVQLASNQPPTAICQVVTVAADANCTADAVIDNGSFDPDGDAVTLAQSPPGPYPLGSTLVTLTVTDIEGASSQCTGTVTVVDEAPPTITGVSVNPNLLWPPNHKTSRGVDIILCLLVSQLFWNHPENDLLNDPFS
jgi:hypothetical protein